MTEEDVRRIVREELAKLPLPALTPLRDYRGHSPVMGCACGPGQCAQQQMCGVPCAHFRQNCA